MPPIYDWKCEKCDAMETTVNPPEKSEVPPETPLEECEHIWKRHYSGKIHKSYGLGWKGRKGFGYH